MKKYLNYILDLIYPRLCVSCQNPIKGHEPYICVSCLMTLPKTHSHISETELLERKFWGKLNVKKTLAFLKFTKKGKVQNILHQLKYKNKPELAEYLGKLYGKELKSVNFDENIDLIIGIPLHKDKKRMRGFNQADHFAKGLSESLQVDYDTEVMKRNVFTTSQTKMARRIDRFKNIEGVFEVINQEKILDKRIALVDDVLTTGATLEIAGAELQAKGCKELYIITIASAY